MTGKAMTAEEHHRRFADRIIEQIKRGAAPWQKPWKPGERILPCNLDTDRPYSGGNSLHLAVVAQDRGYSDTRWGTHRQIQAQGGRIRKGERGTRILSFQDHRGIAVKDPQGRPVTDEQGRRVYRYERLSTPWIKRYAVLNAEQAGGFPSRPSPAVEPIWKAHQEAEKVLDESQIKIRHVGRDRAYYHLGNDEIVFPERGQFPSASHYYQTALHELGHSTGHPERMNRESLLLGLEASFGSQAYAKEELRAEISAMMTGDWVEIGHDPRPGGGLCRKLGGGLARGPSRDPPGGRRRPEDLRLYPGSNPGTGGRERVDADKERRVLDPTRCGEATWPLPVRYCRAAARANPPPSGPWLWPEPLMENDKKAMKARR